MIRKSPMRVAWVSTLLELARACFPAFATLIFAPLAAAAQFAYVASGLDLGDSRVSVIDAASGAVLAGIPVPDRPRVLAVNHAGTRVYVGHGDGDPMGPGSLSVIDATSDKVIAKIVALLPVEQIVVDATDSHVFVLQRHIIGGTVVSVLNARTNQIVADIAMTRIQMMALDPVRPVLYVIDDHAVNIIDTSSNVVIGSIELTHGGNGVRSIAVEASGSRAYVSDFASGVVYVIDLASRAVIATIPVGTFPTDVVLDPAGTMLYVLDWGDDAVSALSTASNTVVATLPLGSYFDDVAEGLSMNPAGSYLYAVVRQIGPRTVRIIDLASFTLIGIQSAGGSSPLPSQALAALPDGSRIFFLDDVHDVVRVAGASGSPSLGAVGVGDFPGAVAIGPVVAFDSTQPANIPALHPLMLIALTLLIAAAAAYSLTDAAPTRRAVDRGSRR